MFRSGKKRQTRWMRKVLRQKSISILCLFCSLMGWASWPACGESILKKSRGVILKVGEWCDTSNFSKWPIGSKPLWDSGAGSRIRTDDRLITNQVLYQLSYTGVSAEEGATAGCVRQAAGTYFPVTARLASLRRRRSEEVFAGMASAAESACRAFSFCPMAA